jgi:hypothetical protein
MTRRLTLTATAGALSILVYLCFTLVSYAYYPAAFNPRDNWLSDLGNGSLNPSGALLYRFGCVLTGVLLALFFVGLKVMARGQPTKVRVFFWLSQGLGLIAAFALIMTGIFSEGAHASHSFWSAVLYISFGTAVFFCGWAFLYLPRFSRSVSYLAFAITVINWVMAAFNKTYFLEWIVVTLMLVFVGAVSYRVSRDRSRRLTPQLDSEAHAERPHFLGIRTR